MSMRPGCFVTIAGIEYRIPPESYDILRTLRDQCDTGFYECALAAHPSALLHIRISDIQLLSLLTPEWIAATQDLMASEVPE